jgi:hypothetical protein
MDRRRLLKLTSIAIGGAAVLPTFTSAKTTSTAPGLWSVWDTVFACTLCFAVACAESRYTRMERFPVDDKIPARHGAAR